MERLDTLFWDLNTQIEWKGWIARVFQQGYFSSQVTITYAIMDNMVYLIIYISFEFWLFDNKNPSVGLWIYVDRYFSVLKYLQK